MPIRGERPTMPKAPKTPTGIFSTRGKQKKDSVDRFPDKSVQRYAHGNHDKVAPVARDNGLKK